VQQLREAFPYKPAAKFLILDHDSKYGAEVPAAIRAMEINITSSNRRSRAGLCRSKYKGLLLRY
jgi:hypothetical protein